MGHSWLLGQGYSKQSECPQKSLHLTPRTPSDEEEASPPLDYPSCIPLVCVSGSDLHLSLGPGSKGENRLAGLWCCRCRVLFGLNCDNLLFLVSTGLLESECHGSKPADRTGANPRVAVGRRGRPCQ